MLASPPLQAGSDVAEQLLPELIEDLLVHGTSIRLAVGGVSMAPRLRNHDVVIIEPLLGKDARFGDLVLYRREDGAPILHRVVRRWRTRLQTRGDANIRLDLSIDTACVLGRVRHIERPGRRHIDLETRRERIRAVATAAAHVLSSALYYKLRFLVGAGVGGEKRTPL
jgi:signal peptidase I